ncbi:MAG: aldo/keto reductase, partial [Alphaproteobacteria bacterium]
TPGGFGNAESLMGEVLAATPGLRGRMVLATKGGIKGAGVYDSSRAYLIAACEASLKRLKTDVIDLYQVHRPDLLAPAEEVAAALEHLLASGKVRFVGLSNYSPSRCLALQAHLGVPLVSHQPEYSAWQLAPLKDGLLDQCQERRMACLAWSPLAGGRLATGEAGDLPAPEQPRFAALVAVLDRLAAQYSATRAQIALAFALATPGPVIPIVGSQTPARIREAAGAAAIRLERQEWYDIYEARTGTRMP